MARRQVRARGAPEVRPLDVDGVRTVAVITVLWAVAFVVLALRRAELVDAGRDWWLWTCLAGVGLGLLGLEYCRRRRDAIAKAELEAEADADFDDPGDWADGELAALAAEDDLAAADYDEQPPDQYPPAHAAPVVAEQPWPEQPVPPARPNQPSRPVRPTEAGLPPGPMQPPGAGLPPVPPEPQPWAQPRPAHEPGPPAPPFSPGGRPPPGHITGEFPAVPAPVEPDVAPPIPPPAPGSDVPGYPTTASAGYAPDPDRTRRHPRDEEIARRYREEQERSQLSGPSPTSDFLHDEPLSGEFGPVVGDEPWSGEFGPVVGDEPPSGAVEAVLPDEPGWPPTQPESDQGALRPTPGFDSEFFTDEPVREPSNAPEFLLDEPDPDDQESAGGRRGRHTRPD
jgi:hypothetical protein